MNKQSRDSLRHLIKVRVVDVETGVITHESSRPYNLDLFYKKDREILHRHLDLYLDKLVMDKAVDQVKEYHLEFVNHRPVEQLKIPF